MKYMCNICGHQTNRQAYLQQHVQLVHQKKSYDVKCTECDLIFVDHSRMLKHRNLVHFPDKYRCSVCQKSFATKTLMTRHMAVHDAEGQFECELCGRKVKKLDALRDRVVYDNLLRYLSQVSRFPSSNLDHTKDQDQTKDQHR